MLRAARGAPVGLALVIAGLTLGERSYLRQVGWSPIHRTRTEWPSLLALGSGGWLLTTAFVLGGISGVLIGHRLWRHAKRRGFQIAGALFIVMNGALFLVAFSPDRPRTESASWHAGIHNLGYPFLLFAGLSSAAVMAVTPAANEPWRRLRTASMVAFPVLVVGATVSSLNPVAQLGRYVLLGGLLVWAGIAAQTAVRLV